MIVREGLELVFFTHHLIALRRSYRKKFEGTSRDWAAAGKKKACFDWSTWNESIIVRERSERI